MLNVPNGLPNGLLRAACSRCSGPGKLAWSFAGRNSLSIHRDPLHHLLDVGFLQAYDDLDIQPSVCRRVGRWRGATCLGESCG
jgi:hypothetical protein